MLPTGRTLKSFVFDKVSPRIMFESPACRGEQKRVEKEVTITDELTTGLRLSDQFKLIGVGHLCFNVFQLSRQGWRTFFSKNGTELPPKDVYS